MQLWRARTTGATARDGREFLEPPILPSSRRFRLMTHPQQEAFDAVVSELLRLLIKKPEPGTNMLMVEFHVVEDLRLLARHRGLDTSIIDKVLGEIRGG